MALHTSPTYALREKGTCGGPVALHTAPPGAAARDACGRSAAMSYIATSCPSADER